MEVDFIMGKEWTLIHPLFIKILNTEQKALFEYKNLNDFP